MKEKKKFVAFSTQKGGAGKTTLTVLASDGMRFYAGMPEMCIRDSPGPPAPTRYGYAPVRCRYA